MRDEFSTCLHEAGHSIASLLLRGQAQEIRIYEPGAFAAGCAGADGFTDPIADDFTEERLKEEADRAGFEEAFSDAVVSAAGHAAQSIFCNRSFLPCDFSASRPDDRSIELLARRAFGAAIDHAVVQAFKGLAHARAVNLLGRRFDAVRAVAERLLKDRTLSSASVAETYAQALIAEEA